MKRIFWESRLYDFTTIEEAEKHIEEMRKKGWYVNKENSTESGIFKNGGDVYPYSVEYHKQH